MALLQSEVDSWILQVTRETSVISRGPARRPLRTPPPVPGSRESLRTLLQTLGPWVKLDRTSTEDATQHTARGLPLGPHDGEKLCVHLAGMTNLAREPLSLFALLARKLRVKNQPISQTCRERPGTF